MPTNQDSHLAATEQCSQWQFSTYLILLLIRWGAARESYKACSVQSVHMITLSCMLSVRDQTSAQ